MSANLALEAEAAARRLVRRSEVDNSVSIRRVVNVSDGNVRTYVDGQATVNTRDSGSKATVNTRDSVSKDSFSKDSDHKESDRKEIDLGRGLVGASMFQRLGHEVGAPTSSRPTSSRVDVPRLSSLSHLVKSGGVTEVCVTHWVNDGQGTFYALRKEAFAARSFVESFADSQKRAKSWRHNELLFLFDDDQHLGGRRVRIAGDSVHFVDTGERRCVSDLSTLTLGVMFKELTLVPDLAIAMRLSSEYKVDGLDFFNKVSKFESVGVRVVGRHDGLPVVEVVDEYNGVINFAKATRDEQKTSKVSCPLIRPVVSAKSSKVSAKKYTLQDLPVLIEPSLQSTHTVQLASLSDTIDVIYFHLTSKKSLLNLEEPEHLEAHTSPPSQDSLVLVRDEQDRLARAVITSHLDDGLRVFYIDYGTVGIVHSTFVLPSHLTSIPALAWPLRLQGVSEGVGFVSASIREAVLDVMTNVKFKVTLTEIQARPMSGTLRSQNDRYFLSSYKMITMDKVECQQMRLRVDKAHLPQRFRAKLKVVLEADMQLILVLDSDLKWLERIHFIAERVFGDESKGCTPSLQDIGLARVKGEYCRVRVVDLVNENFVKCERIDYGDEVRLALPKFLPLLKWLEDLPPLAQKCSFVDYGDPDLSQALLEDLAQNNIDKMVDFSVIRVDEQGCYVLDLTT